MIRRALHVDPTDAAPIWRQIEAGLRRLVAAGALAPGTTLPSVRDLARDLRVNPATVAKAYQRLTDTGVVTVRRGDGTYVSEAPPALAKGERSRALRENALRYASVAMTMGATSDETVQELKGAWTTLKQAPRGGER